MSVFQRDKIPFQMLGKEFQYEFIPSIHFQEILVGIGGLLSTFLEAGDALGALDAAIMPRVLEEARGILSNRIYQIIADVLQHQNNHVVSVGDLKLKTRPLEIAGFLDTVIQDPELYEALTTLGKSLAALIGKLNGHSATPSSTPSSPTTSDSSMSTSITV
jgi:hypothetical protein